MRAPLLLGRSTPAARPADAEPRACRLTLRVDPRRRPFALRAFEFVGMTWNVRFVLVDDEPSLLYTEAPDSAGAARVIRCDPSYYVRGGEFRSVEDDGEVYWLPRGADTSRADDIGTIVRLLGLLDDPLPDVGAGALSALPLRAFSQERQAIAAIPLADRAARRVLERAGLAPPELPPRWPGGKTYALCLTHDVDSPEIGNPRELLRAAAKTVVRRGRRSGHAWALRRGITALARGDAGEFWTFSAWQRYERERGLRSAFYVYPAAPGVPRHRNDPRYDISGTRWSVLHELAAEGWEVGVHHGIRGRDATAHLLREKQALEHRGIRVDGSRHHYWELDWREPATTFRRHAEAGYRYDASMTWKDVPGFRCGTAQPYLPFDPATGGRIDLVVLPTCLMDGHLFEYLGLAEDAAVEAGSRVLAAARAAGGVAMLDWHERTFSDTPAYPGWRAVLDRLLDEALACGDAWLALPREIAAFSLARARATRIAS